MLVARSYKDDRRFRLAAEHLLTDLQTNPGAASQPARRSRKARSRHGA
jgi:hypothetical protein